uniref:Uncharacterized protein n=1 Tax=Chromera velia CCMP2878 TaxID=1169474 RepID=A0A0G4FDG4_9ALVE|mmetsp:Transcript_10288/g.19949  ORF Transcript_10288/g.19949 Transcript_10288/m.19949 type:complete len:582 (-) Transcript_10288:67-1812(-)|eukprot:Cvel_16485.t1-p1 / transcript=Cvel_16485.t1 / gene=Cvel_16485 / organism=Chromera_velia_CCMP2878 / gene_product=hypothetical protein / transcript_product=hypothetical protein / location=Cvel_scaffold1271:8702-11969(+) / protein_length=581 / sequence_SO=supercontig / SO=protein_coding / is_pseudo=false
MMRAPSAVRKGCHRSIPLRDSWHNLGSYTLTEKDSSQWRAIKAKDSVVEGTISAGGTAPPPIDWAKWDAAISHKNIVSSMKGFHDAQVAILDAALKEDHSKEVLSHTKGWDLLDSSVKSCEKSVEKSEEIVANGARALWLSARNPDLWSIDTNEWIDSDAYWQAFMEKHFFHNDPEIETSWDLESDEFDKAMSDEFIKMKKKFNDKSDVPVNFSMMAQYCSWEYYDVYRRALFEHMLYYLTRTGGDARFFPEIPPPAWLVQIEELRSRFVNVAHRRRCAKQDAGLLRVAALDLQPADYEHGHGEHHHEDLVAAESENFEFAAARLMGSYALFADPYVPCQSAAAVVRAVGLDGGAGKFVSVGADVNCIFYLPSEGATSMATPSEANTALLDHLAMTGRRLNPSYANLMQIFADTVESRGDPWLTAPGESVADAFLRRLKSDDPARPVFEAYVAELKAKFSNSNAEMKTLSLDEVLQRMPAIEQRYGQETALYEQLRLSIAKQQAGPSREAHDMVLSLKDEGGLGKALASGSLTAVDPLGPSVAVGEEGEFVESLSAFQSDSVKVVEAVEGTKVEALDMKKK